MFRSAGSRPIPDQPRMTFEQSALDELSASIKEHGILQPVLLRPFGDAGHYQLIAGERRWRAAKAAGLDSIPAMIEEIDDDTALEIAIIENLQREDLSPARRGDDVRPDGQGPRLQHSPPRAEAGQGQGLPREPSSSGRRARGDSRARVFAQGHPVPCLRADEGRGSRRSVGVWLPRSPAASCRWSS